MPPIDVTIAVNREDFTIRIADRGKGTPFNNIKNTLNKINKE